MQHSTTELYTHGVAADTSAKNLRISLTFRYMICKLNTFPLKKARLEINKVNSDDSAPKLLIDELNQNDWFEKFYQRIVLQEPYVAQWSHN